MLAFCAGTAWEMLGWPGAIVSVAAASVPSGIMVMLLTGSYDVVRSNPNAMAAVAGTLAAAVGIMAMATWQLIQPYLDRKRGLTSWCWSGLVSCSPSNSISTPIAVLGLAAAAGASGGCRNECPAALPVADQGHAHFLQRSDLDPRDPARSGPDAARAYRPPTERGGSGRANGAGPERTFVVSVGYFVGGVAGGFAGLIAVMTPAFLIIPMLQYLGRRADKPA